MQHFFYKVHPHSKFPPPPPLALRRDCPLLSLTPSSETNSSLCQGRQELPRRHSLDRCLRWLDGERGWRWRQSGGRAIVGPGSFAGGQAQPPRPLCRPAAQRRHRCRRRRGVVDRPRGRSVVPGGRGLAFPGSLPCYAQGEAVMLLSPRGSSEASGHGLHVQAAGIPAPEAARPLVDHSSLRVLRTQLGRLRTVDAVRRLLGAAPRVNALPAAHVDHAAEPMLCTEEGPPGAGYAVRRVRSAARVGALLGDNVFHAVETVRRAEESPPGAGQAERGLLAAAFEHALLAAHVDHPLPRVPAAELGLLGPWQAVRRPRDASLVPAPVLGVPKK
ncbi:unnamed protein product [Ectocarpus sp. 12 AP-2014]